MESKSWTVYFSCFVFCLYILIYKLLQIENTVLSSNWVDISTAGCLSSCTTCNLEVGLPNLRQKSRPALLPEQQEQVLRLGAAPRAALLTGLDTEAGTVRLSWLHSTGSVSQVPLDTDAGAVALDLQ